MRAQMRIGIVTGEYPPLQGGVGAYSRILAETFTKQGHTVFVFSNKQTREHNPAIELTNTTNTWRFNTLKQIKHWAKHNQLDVMNIQYQTAAFGMSPFIHFIPDYIRHIPVLTTFHDLLFPYLFPKAGPLRNWIVMHLAKSSAGAIATNHEDMECIKHLPHTTMIPIGSNILTELPDDYHRDVWRSKAQTKPDDYVLAYFGFMNRSKGIEALLDAVARLKDESYPVKLIMIGGRTGSSDPTNAAYADEVDERINKLDLAANIHWTGFVDDAHVTAYLKASDAVVLPFRDGASFRRGSLMAAIQHGCAIITTPPQVPIAEFVDGENMLLTQDISGALIKLHQDEQLKTRLQQGAKTLSKHFNWETIARDYVSIFNDLINTEKHR